MLLLAHAFVGGAFKYGGLLRIYSKTCYKVFSWSFQNFFENARNAFICFAEMVLTNVFN